MSADITPFRIDIPQEQLDDLHDRLGRTPVARRAAGRRLGHRRPDHLVA
jgi:hypothetical protein